MEGSWFHSLNEMTYPRLENHVHKPSRDFCLLNDLYILKTNSVLSLTSLKNIFSLRHAEEVPLVDLQKPPCDVFYLPMHAVH